jgi:hypothetical protein
MGALKGEIPGNNGESHFVDHLGTKVVPVYSFRLHLTYITRRIFYKTLLTTVCRRSGNMTSGLEQAALSGELFRMRSASPTRSDSTSSPTNTDDELASDLEDNINESSAALVRPQPEKGARTGIKGVLNDKKTVDKHKREAGRIEAEEMRKRMEKSAITVPIPSDNGVEEWRKKRMMELEAGRRGLKEVGKEGFVSAVEKRGWVLVLIYEPVSSTASRHCCSWRSYYGATSVI